MVLPSSHSTSNLPDPNHARLPHHPHSPPSSHASAPDSDVRGLELSIAALRASNAALERTQTHQAAEIAALRALLESRAPDPPTDAGLGQLSFSLADRLRPAVNCFFPCFQARPDSPDYERQLAEDPDQAALLIDYDGRPTSLELDDDLFRPAHHRAHNHPDLISLHSRVGQHDRSQAYGLEASSTLSRWELLGSWLASRLCPSSQTGRLALDDTYDTVDDRVPLLDELSAFAARPSGQTDVVQPKPSRSHAKRLSRAKSLELVSPKYVQPTAHHEQASGAGEHVKKRTRQHTYRPSGSRDNGSGRTGSTAGSESTSSSRCPAKKRPRGGPEREVVASNCSLAFPAEKARRWGSSTEPQPVHDGPAEWAVSSATSMSGNRTVLMSTLAEPEKPGPELDSSLDQLQGKGFGAVVVQLVLVALSVRLGTMLLLLSLPRLGLVPCFDCSARVRHAAVEGLVRWDSLHFLAMGSAGGRQVEQDWAFGRGVVWLVRLGERLTRWSGAAEAERMVVGAAVAAGLASVGSSVVLFLLTFELTRSLKFASLVGFLHVFSPSPSTQVVPYTEPFYALLSFGGTYAFVCSNRIRNTDRIWWWKRAGLKLVAAGLAGLATAVRSIGVLQSVVWVGEWWNEHGWMVMLFCQGKRMNRKTAFKLMTSLIEPIVLSLITCGAFIGDQLSGYLEYCTTNTSFGGGRREWCFNRVPSIYNFVQSHYWNVGFLRYWTLAQSPLFILSSPLYYISFKIISRYYSNYIKSLNHGKFLKEEAQEEEEERPFFGKKLLVHVHLQLVLSLLLLFNSHVQIVFRQVSTIPAFWWGLGDLVGCDWGWWGIKTSSNSSGNGGGGKRNGNENERIVGKNGFGSGIAVWWFWWVILWGICSVVLWAGFYPPA